MPKVAIITRTKDRPSLLKRAIESILGQQFSDWQHVIVNDGGDESALNKFLEPYQERYQNRLKVIHQENKGMQEAANEGIKNSDSEFISIHDDDDQWDPAFLNTLVEFLENEGEASIYQGAISQTELIIEKTTQKDQWVVVERKPYIPLQEVTIFRVGFENPFPPIAFLYRRKVHDILGMFNPRWDVVADLDFNYRFLQHFEIGVVQKTLAYYHWRDVSEKGVNANSITTGQARHRKLLFELKNHYLRSANSHRDLATALSFQLSQYLVDNEWMTVEIRDRVNESFSELQKLNQQVDMLRTFQNESAWPKLAAMHEELEGDSDLLRKLRSELRTASDQLIHLVENLNKQAPEKLQALQDKLVSVDSQIEEIRRFNNEAAWPKFEALNKFNRETAWPKLEAIDKFNHESAWPKLESIDKFNHESAWPKLESIDKFNHESAWPKLESIDKFNHESAWPKLESIDKFNHESAWPKLEAIHHDLNKLRQFVDEHIDQFHKQLQLANQQLDSVRKFQNETTWPYMEEVRNKLHRIHAAVTPTQHSLLKIGRLSLEWNSRKRS